MLNCQNIGFFAFFGQLYRRVRNVFSKLDFKKQPDELIQVDSHKKLDDRERRHLQHEFKIYMEQYFKQKLGKGVDYTKVIIWDDMLIIRGERFLTEPEVYIVKTPAGKEVVRAARMQVAWQHSIDNLPHFEERLKARAIHQVYDVEPENDFWIHVVIFDRILTE
jgi:uncharacterized protein YbcI